MNASFVTTEEGRLEMYRSTLQGLINYHKRTSLFSVHCPSIEAGECPCSKTCCDVYTQALSYAVGLIDKELNSLEGKASSNNQL